MLAKTRREDTRLDPSQGFDAPCWSASASHPANALCAASTRRDTSAPLTTPDRPSRRSLFKASLTFAASALLPKALHATSIEGERTPRLHSPESEQNKPGKVIASYLPNSARRLSQVTGKLDPTGLPHRNDTTKWSISGTDMGCPVEFQGRLYLLFGDVPTTTPIDLDPVCYTTDHTLTSNNVRLQCVTQSDGSFQPLTVDGATLSTNETATGAFAYDDRLWAFVVRGNSSPYSTLVSTEHPAKSVDFTSHYNISDVHGKFWQIAPWVIDNARWPGLPSTSGKGLLLWGQSRNAVYLAWMPLTEGIPPLNTIRYSTGERGWSTDQSMAAPVFLTNNITQVSVTWLEAPQKWIFLYTKASLARPHESVVARVGADPWTWSDELIVFNPDRDNAWGKYMYERGHDTLYNNEPVRSPALHGYAYSPFLLKRYTTWNVQSHELKLIYLMATFVPYQLMLMEAILHLPG